MSKGSTSKRGMSAASEVAQKAADGKGKVHLFLLIDESGSMKGLEEAVVTACNEFMVAFKDNAQARIWLAWFDYSPGEPALRVKVAGAKAKDVKALVAEDYTPRGRTPLYDAILGAVGHLDNALAKDKKARAFLSIITDGLENESEATEDAVRQVLEAREAAGWGIQYLGANQDAAKVAAGLGLRQRGQAVTFQATKGGVLRSARVGTSFAQSYGAGGQSAMYATAAALHDKTGGVLPEDDGDEGDGKA